MGPRSLGPVPLIRDLGSTQEVAPPHRKKDGQGRRKKGSITSLLDHLYLVPLDETDGSRVPAQPLQPRPHPPPPSTATQDLGERGVAKLPK